MLEPGDHGSTFAGGPLVAAAALAVLDIVDDPALLRGVRELGAALREGLLGAARRARGPRPRADARASASRRASTPPRSAPTCSSGGLIVNVPEPGTLRLLPPLIVEAEQIERAVALIGESLLEAL